MEVKNLIKLVNAGYSLTEIKNMTNRETVIELLDGGVNREDIPDYIEVLEEKEKDSSAKPEEEKKEEKKDETDYKEKYETLLKQTQEKERRKPMDEGKERTAEKILSEIAISLM